MVEVYRLFQGISPRGEAGPGAQVRKDLGIRPGAFEIQADDVRCSHGATVGQLDAESRFYLMSRGLTREQAERLVVLGFLGEVLSRLPLGGVVEKVTNVIEEKLRQV